MVAERDAEIVADRGLNGKVSPDQWHAICVALERDVAIQGLVPAVCAAVITVGDLVRKHYPSDDSVNELSDDAIIRG
jgi:uncharacterized membrane protein